VHWLAQFLPNPDGSPSQGGDFRISPTPFLIMLGVGFLLGVIGHVNKSKSLVAVGVGLVFLATVVIPLYLAITR